MGMSDWVLSQVLPDARETFQGIASQLASTENPTYILAELNDLLTSLTSDEYLHAVCERPRTRLNPQSANYLAAMVEQAATIKGTRPPAWTLEVPPLNEPLFGSSVPALRLYLLMNSPPPFHRRNLFIDSTIGDRV